MSMPLLTILTGGLLMVLGISTYIATGSSHTTALIPAILGAVLGLLGGVALRHGLRKHAMHAAAGLSLVGLVAALIMAVPRLGQLVQEGRFVRPDGTDGTTSTWAILGMGLLCLVHVLLCVNSFIAARRAARTNPPVA